MFASAPTHVSLSVRKALLSRILLYEAIDPHKSYLDTTFHGKLDDLYNSVNAITIQELENPNNEVPLDDYLSSLVAELKSRLLTHGADDVQRAFTPVFSCLSHRLKEFCCADCSPNHICNGSWGDDAAVSLRGQCISNFTTLFACIINLVKELHRKAGIALSARCDPLIKFSTEYAAEKISPFDTDYQVNGRTDFLDAQSFVSRVALRVCPAAFDEDTLLAIVYVLFHEIVSHVFQGCWGDKREYPSPGDSFADGWMDYVAKEVIARLAYGWIPGSRTNGCYPNNRHRSIAEDFHRNKHTRKHRDTRRTKLGVEAATRMLVLLNALPEVEEPWHDMLGMSLDINTSSISHEGRQHFVSSIYAILPSCHERLSSKPWCTTSAALNEAIAEYRATRDIGGLLVGVTAIPPPQI